VGEFGGTAPKDELSIKGQLAGEAWERSKRVLPSMRLGELYSLQGQFFFKKYDFDMGNYM
jgi:hypothetical protein